MNIISLIKFETKKLFKQKPALAGYIIIVLASILFCVLNVVNRPPGSYTGIDMIMDNLHLQNNILFIFPMVAILLAVHSLSGEISTGTLRTLLTKPIKRENILLSKFFALLIYVCAAFYGTFIISLVIGFRWGYPDETAAFVLRIVFVYFVYVLGTMVLVAFTFLTATLVTSPVITALISLGFHRLWMIIETFAQIRDYTFSYHVSSAFQLLIARSINYRLLWQSLAVILIYMLAFLLIAVTLWDKRDIHT